MWMIDPKLMCQQHILGEHSEIHKHKHNFEKGHSIAGRRGLIEPQAMQARHDQLAAYMNHKSPYEMPDLSGYDLTGFVVDREESLRELCRRCPDCRAKIERIG